MEAAQRALKDLVFQRWLDEACEQRADTLKSIGLVDFFLPFLPLERRHLVALFEARLQERRGALRRAQRSDLAWEPDVVHFLADRVSLLASLHSQGHMCRAAQELCSGCLLGCEEDVTPSVERCCALVVLALSCLVGLSAKRGPSR